MRSSLLLEAIVVGLMNASFFYALTQMKIKLSTPWIIFIVGALIHLVFEFAGLNEWWCRQTYK